MKCCPSLTKRGVCWSTPPDMNLRPYQEKAVAFLQDKARAFVVAPAGSGKTIIAAAAAAQRFPFGRIIWLANTREQVQQAEAAAAAFGIEISAHCVAAQVDCTDADLVIVDEAHHMPATTWTATVARAKGVVWGFSATPWAGDLERDQALKTFFQNFHVVPRDEVMAGGSITEGRVVIHDIDRAGEFDSWIDEQTAIETERRCRRFPFMDPAEHERRARWQATAEAVRLNERRNGRISALLDSEPGSVLVLVSTVEHGEELAKGVWTPSTVVHSKLGKKKRADAIAAFRDGSLRVMIATSLADEGLDVPRASVLILAAGGRSAAKLEQRAGRVMRPHEGKEFGVVHDFADRGAGLAHSQYWARFRTYKKLGYSVEFSHESCAAC